MRVRFAGGVFFTTIGCLVQVGYGLLLGFGAACVLFSMLLSGHRRYRVVIAVAGVVLMLVGVWFVWTGQFVG